MSKPSATIGLEIHVQLQTRTKIFCDSPVKFGAPPNTLTCPICLGHPGTMPKLNRRAVEQALLLALAMDCQINQVSTFARKSYLYPDLPKGYQITQHNHPLATGGRLYYEAEDMEGTMRWAPIARVHLEEDAGKLIHHIGDKAGSESSATMVDFNRAGVPLAEIVTEPCFNNPSDAVAFLRTLHTLVRWLGVSDANMEEGAFRCDANVSYGRWPGTGASMGAGAGAGVGAGANIGTSAKETAPNRTELKNMNTFKGIQRALAFEVDRQKTLYEAGQEIKSETRLWDETTGQTVSMRSKESAPDYRYIPEPDLPPLELSGELIERFRKEIPELPWGRKQRYEDEFNLTSYETKQLNQDRALGDYFEAVVDAGIAPRNAASWVMTELLRQKTRTDIPALANGYNVPPHDTGNLLRILEEGRITRTSAKKVFEKMWTSGASAEQIIREDGLENLPDRDSLQEMLQAVALQHPGELSRLLEGDSRIISFFMGRLMERTKGKADPVIARQLIMELAENQRASH